MKGNRIYLHIEDHHQEDCDDGMIFGSPGAWGNRFEAVKMFRVADGAAHNVWILAEDEDGKKFEISLPRDLVSRLTKLRRGEEKVLSSNG